MLIESEAPLHVGPADLVHRRSGKIPWGRSTIVTGASMECDGEAPAQMTLENGDILHAEVRALNVTRFVLLVAQLVDKGAEVRFSPSGIARTSPMGKVVKAKRLGSLFLVPMELAAPVENDEKRAPVDGGEV